jgi:hypothetical protein
MSGARHELTAFLLFRLCSRGGNLGPKPANMKSRLELKEDRLSHLVASEYFWTGGRSSMVFGGAIQSAFSFTIALTEGKFQTT